MSKKIAIAAPAIAAAIALSAVVPASAQTHAQHGYGVDMRAVKTALADAAAHGRLARPSRARVPASYDLSKYALAPGDQGQLNSCTTWATGYSAYGILMAEKKIDGAPMAPMYIYSQLDKGQNQGTAPSDVLSMEQDQGIDTRGDYTQGDADNTTQPTDAERKNAAHFKLSGFDPIQAGKSANTTIKSALADGHPVVMSLNIRGSFDNMDSATARDYSYAPGDDSSDPVDGSHEVAIIGYNKQGVRVENSWGTQWGDGGFVNLSWDFIDSSEIGDFNVVNDLAT